MVLETSEDNASALDQSLQPPALQPELPPAAEGTTPSAEAQQPGGAEEAPPALAAEPTMGEVTLEDYDYVRPKRGEIREGRVTAMNANEVVVDIGAKRECVVSASDYQKVLSEGEEVHVDDTVSVYIIKAEDRDGHLVGSLSMALVERDWAHAEELEESGEIFEAKVVGQNRGGLLVPFGRLRGFVPASHLVGMNETSDRATVLSHWIGKSLPFKVIEVNRRRNRLILSYRAARRQWRAQQSTAATTGEKKGLIDEMGEGDIRKGIVSSLATFGAFVDLGGADGLIHVSEMAWYRVEHPSELLQVGQEVEVYILRVDRERGRVGLSLKRLQADPWTLVNSKYYPDQTVEARITKLVDFGAFAEVEKGIEGLIHITELAEPAPARAEEVVQPGDVRLLRVLRIDPQNRRIGLSLKAVDPLELEIWQTRRSTSGRPAEPPAAEPAAADEAAGDAPEPNA